jgi:hypothetical protein
MTREERLGLNILAVFVVGTVAFYAMALGPRLLKLERRTVAESLASDPEPGLLPVDEQAPLGALSGRFVDESSHEPLFPEITIAGIGHIAQPEMEVQPDGTFRITALPTGVTFQLRAVRTSYAPRVFDYAFARGESLALGDLSLKRIVHLDGRAVDARGQALARARVSAFACLPRYARREQTERAVLDLLCDHEPEARSSILAGPGGDFDLGDFAGCDVDLFVDAGAEGCQLMRCVSLRGESRRHVRLNLDGGVPLSGIVQDEQGQALAGARVVLLPRDDERPWRSCVSNERGEFQLSAVIPGQYLLSAGRRGLAARTPVSLSVPSAPATHRLLEARPSAAAPSASDWQLSVASASSGWPLDGACALRLGGGAKVFGPAGERGDLRVRDVAGTHLSVGAAGHRPVEVALDASAAQPLRVLLEPCPDVRVRIQTEGGEPLARALVVIEWSEGLGTLQPPPSCLQGETTVNGELDLPILGERLDARILSEDRRLLGQWSSNVTAGRTITATVPHAASVSGALRTKDGQAVNDALVWISLGDETVWGTTLTVGQGAFEFQVPPGLTGASVEAQSGTRHAKRELPAMKSGAAIVGFDLVLGN